MSDQEMEADEKASTATLIAAGLSILYSWYLFYLEGEKIQGLFVGLWAPSILSISNFVEQTGLTETMETDADVDV